MNKITITIIVFLVLSLGFNAWTYFKLKRHGQALNNQAVEIIQQKAAWQVMLSTLQPTDQQKFIDSVNQILKPK